MVFKGKTTYWLIISFMFIVALSVSGFVFFEYYEAKKQAVDEQELLIIRNNYLLKDMAYNMERIRFNEKEIKEKLEYAIILYRLSYGIFFNGGIVPKRDKNKILPPAEEEYRQLFTEVTNYTEEIRKLSEYVIQTPYHIYMSNLGDSMVNGKVVVTDISERRVNPQVIQNIEQFTIKTKEAEEINNKLLDIALNKKSKYENGQQIALFIVITLITILSVVHLIIINKKLFKELKQLLGEFAKPEKAFQKHTPYYQEYTTKTLFESFDNFRNILSQINKTIKHITTTDLKTKPIEEIQNTPLHETLLDLQEQLQKIEEEKIIKLEESKIRNWNIQGRNKIIKILQTIRNINELADRLIVELVKYLKAAQGGIFILNNKDGEEPYLEMLSAFAYDRKKIIEKQIPLGEGLLGMVALEKNTYWLKEIPRDYIEIESGLGESPPKTLVISPLIADRQVIGVMEIASINKFKEYEVDFIKEISQSIGAALNTAQVTERTAQLLEESRKKTEELAIQDATMQLKLKEIEETQNIAKKSKVQMTSLIQLINKSFLKCELDLDGNIKGINDKFLLVTNFYEEELINIKFRTLLSESYAIKFDEKIEQIKNDKPTSFILFMKTKTNEDLWMRTQMILIKDENNKPINILLIGVNVTKQKELESKNDSLLKETQEATTALTQIQKQLTEKQNEINAITEKLKIEKQNEINTITEKLQKEIKYYKSINKQTIQETSTPDDTKYFNWIDEIATK